MIGAALFFADPVLATSCDERQIAEMSVEDAAEMIWARSDVIGFGYVSTLDTAEREQQFIDIVVSLKGADARRIPFAPLRVGRTRWNAPGVYRRRARADEIVFVTLLRTEEGYITPACRELLLSKNKAAIIRRLATMSRHRR